MLTNSAHLPDFMFPPWHVEPGEEILEEEVPDCEQADVPITPASKMPPKYASWSREEYPEYCAILRFGKYLLARHGLKSWQFVISNCVYGCDARCCYKNRTIEMHGRMLLRPRRRIREIILHEIAHALCGQKAASHGPKWIKMALELGVGRRHIDFNLKLYARQTGNSGVNRKGREQPFQGCAQPTYLPVPSTT